MTAVTPTDRPKSVRSRCVIKVFRGIFLCRHVAFWMFYGCRVFCHTTESDLFFLARLHFIAEELLLYPRRQRRRPRFKPS